MPGIGGLDGLAEADVDAAAPQVGERGLGGVRAEAVEQPRGGLHECDPKGGGRPGQFAGHRGERPGGLDAGGAAAGHNDVDRRGGGTGRVACSSVLSRCLRSRIASGSVYSGHPCSRMPGTPKKFASAPGGHDQVVEVEREPSWSTSAWPGSPAGTLYRRARARWPAGGRPRGARRRLLPAPGSRC